MGIEHSAFRLMVLAHQFTCEFNLLSNENHFNSFRFNNSGKIGRIFIKMPNKQGMSNKIEVSALLRSSYLPSHSGELLTVVAPGSSAP